MNKNKIIAVVPAKSSSERVKSKNCQLLGGIPLFIYTLKKLQDADFISEVWLDTDSQDMANMVSDYGYSCKIMLRDKEFANNKTDGNKLLLNEIEHIDGDIFIQILCTSPFTKLSSIKKGLDIIFKGEYDSIVGGAKDKFYLWRNHKPLYDINNIPNSKDLPDFLMESMSLYIIPKKVAIDTKRRIGNKPYFIELDKIETVDIDYPDDLDLAKLINNGLELNTRKRYNLIKQFMHSEILIDIMSEMNLRHQFLPYFNQNIEFNKIMGRARLLDLKYLEENDNPDGIYDALESYKTCELGNIIFVNNPCEGCAYFGGLNATISKSKNVEGVIINGDTRDYDEVKQLNLPVYYKRLISSDIKNVGTVKSMNKKIKLNDKLTIYQDDLIFADKAGIIIFPKKEEKIILNRVMEVLRNEHSIKNKIIDGIPLEKILEENGKF